MVNQKLKPRLRSFFGLKCLFILSFCYFFTLACSDPSSQPELNSSETSKSQGMTDGKVDDHRLTSEPSRQQDLSCSTPNTGWDPNGIHKMSGTQQFEGWYYRVTEPNRAESWVIITAYWRDRLGDTRAFIELIQCTRLLGSN